MALSGSKKRKKIDLASPTAWWLSSFILHLNWLQLGYTHTNRLNGAVYHMNKGLSEGVTSWCVCVCVCELFKQTHLQTGYFCVCVCLLGVFWGQEARPVGKHHSERSRGRLMVTARAGLAAPEDTHTELMLSNYQFRAVTHKKSLNNQRFSYDNR